MRGNSSSEELPPSVERGGMRSSDLRHLGNHVATLDLDGRTDLALIHREHSTSQFRGIAEGCVQKAANTLPEQIRSRSVALLNRHLAAAIDLHAQVKQAHWNVRGPTFIAIHELFDKVADVVEEYSDKLAERAGTLGGAAEGTVQTAAQKSIASRSAPAWSNPRTASS